MCLTRPTRWRWWTWSRRTCWNASGPQAAQALDHFFSLKNLASLREIALRRTADQLESSPRFQGEVKPKAGEHILICLSGAPSNAKVIRTAARMAKAFHGAFTALFVETSDFASQSEQDLSLIHI